MWVLMLVFFLTDVALAGAQNFSERFTKGEASYGVQVGFGATFDLPPGRDRTDLSFLFLFPNYQYNLTGLIKKDSFLSGALYWHVEAGLAELVNRDGEYLFGFTPLMVQYKFLNPKRSWAPNILVGAGFAMTNWKDQATAELGSEFQFLLHFGGGVEFFRKQGSYSFNYRLFHVSNGGIQRPNIGLNSHVFSLGLRF